MEVTDLAVQSGLQASLDRRQRGFDPTMSGHRQALGPHRCLLASALLDHSNGCPTRNGELLFSSQTDLFAELAAAYVPAAVVFEVTPDLVARIRAELNSTLQRVRTAELLPWPDLTRTMLAGLLFNSIARWRWQRYASRSPPR